ERLVLSRETPRDEPENVPFDQRDPDVIVAGFGRFGQIATRLLVAHDFKLVTLESSIEQIEILRRFGWSVHYGDASRLDLLRAAGAEEAKVVVVRIDRRAQGSEI